MLEGVGGVIWVLYDVCEGCDRGVIGGVVVGEW